MKAVNPLIEVQICTSLIRGLDLDLESSWLSSIAIVVHIDDNHPPLVDGCLLKKKNRIIVFLIFFICTLELIF